MITSCVICGGTIPQPLIGDLSRWFTYSCPICGVYTIAESFKNQMKKIDQSKQKTLVNAMYHQLLLHKVENKDLPYQFNESELKALCEDIQDHNKRLRMTLQNIYAKFEDPIFDLSTTGMTELERLLFFKNDANDVKSKMITTLRMLEDKRWISINPGSEDRGFITDQGLDIVATDKTNAEIVPELSLPEMDGKSVFISHSSKDKDEFVRDLSMHLRELGVNAFYDEFSIKWGDSITEKINEGLNKCDYGIIVLSNNFFDGTWTIVELTALFNNLLQGKTRILPIYHNITAAEVKVKFPVIGDRLALQSNEGIPEICRQLLDTMGLIDPNATIKQGPQSEATITGIVRNSEDSSVWDCPRCHQTTYHSGVKCMNCGYMDCD